MAEEVEEDFELQAPEADSSDMQALTDQRGSEDAGMSV